MKKLFALLALTLAMSMFMISCGDEDDDTNTGPSDMTLGKLTATVNGAEWEIENGVFLNTSKSVRGEKTTGDLTEIINVSLDVTGDLEAKTYSAVCYYRSSENGENLLSWNDTEASAVITEVNDDEISGSFSFTGTNSNGTEKKITGTFRVKRSWTGV